MKNDSAKNYLLHFLLQIFHHIILQSTHFLELDQPSVLVIDLVDKVEDFLAVFLLTLDVYELALLVGERQTEA